MSDNTDHYHLSDRFPSRDSLQWLNGLERITYVSSNYTVISLDDIIIVDSTSGNVMITLPSPKNGRRLIVSNSTGSHNVTVGSTVLGASSSVLLKALDSSWLALVSGSATNVIYPNINNTWLKSQRGTFVTLTSSSASIAVDLSLANNFKHTLTENTTLASPSNVVAGQSGLIEFTQHASSPKTLAFNSFWKFSGGTVATLTATNSALDLLSYTTNSSGTSATCSILKDIK